MVCLCCHPLWCNCAVIHYGLSVLSSTLVYLCCHPLWSVCAVIHSGLFVRSSYWILWPRWDGVRWWHWRKGYMWTHRPLLAIDEDVAAGDVHSVPGQHQVQLVHGAGIGACRTTHFSNILRPVCTDLLSLPLSNVDLGMQYYVCWCSWALPLLICECFVMHFVTVDLWMLCHAFCHCGLVNALTCILSM